MFRLVPDQVRIIELPPESSPAAAKPGRGEDDATAVVRAIIDEQVQVLRVSRQPRKLCWLRRIRGARRRQCLCATPAPKIGQNRSNAPARPRSFKSNPGALLAVLDEARGALTATLRVLRCQNRKRSTASGRPELRRGARSLRVAEAKIDALVDLAGELLVVKNGFAHLARRLEENSSHHDLRARHKRPA